MADNSRAFDTLVTVPQDPEPEFPDFDDPVDEDGLVSFREALAMAIADPADTNMAEFIDFDAQRDIARTLITWADADKESRAKWDRQFSEGLKRIDLTLEQGRELPEVEGAMEARYPLLKQAATQFNARTMEEIFPPMGPVKTDLKGKKSKPQREQARRVADHLNWQITSKDKGWFSDDDRGTMLLPYSGTIFKHVSYDPDKHRNISRLIRPDNLHYPYSSPSFSEAPRYFLSYFQSAEDFRADIVTGRYRDVLSSDDVPDVASVSRSDPELLTETGAEVDEIDAVEDISYGSGPDPAADGYNILEGYVGLDFSEEEPCSASGHQVPFKVLIERDSNTILAIYADWDIEEDLPELVEKESEYPQALSPEVGLEEDATFREPENYSEVLDTLDELLQDFRPERLEHIVQYNFLPGFGSMGIGLIHAVGDLDDAATDLLQTISTAGKFASTQGGFVSNQVGHKGTILTTSPGIYEPIDLSPEELNKAFYTPPFRDPAASLYQVLGMVIEAGKSYTSTTEALTGDAPSTGPVGTMSLLVEQGSKVYSGIHKRIHNVKRVEYEILHRLTRTWLAEDGYPYPLEDGSEPEVMWDDFNAGLAILPVSDPNISSGQQKIANAQALLELANTHPELFNIYEANRRMLEALRVPDINAVLIDPEEFSQPADPASENAIALVGRPLKVHPAENHQAHMIVHDAMKADQAVMQLPEEILGPLLMSIDNHTAVHRAYDYLARMGVQPDMLPFLEASPGQDPLPDLPVQMLNQVAGQQAQLVANVDPAGNVQPPPPPPTPEQIKMQEEAQLFQQRLEHKDADHQQKQQHTEEDHRQDMGHEQERLQVKEREMQMELQAAEQQAALDREKTIADRLTAKKKADGK